MFMAWMQEIERPRTCGLSGLRTEEFGAVNRVNYGVYNSFRTKSISMFVMKAFGEQPPLQERTRGNIDAKIYAFAISF